MIALRWLKDEGSDLIGRWWKQRADATRQRAENLEKAAAQEASEMERQKKIAQAAVLRDEADRFERDFEEVKEMTSR